MCIFEKKSTSVQDFLHFRRSQQFRLQRSQIDGTLFESVF